MTGENFNELVETIYSLSLDYKEELKELLEHNISDSRREEIAARYQSASKEQKSGSLKFSSKIDELKKML